MNIKEKNALCIFVKYPEPGKVKTRLQPELTAQQAAKFYKAMVEDLISDADKSDAFDVLVFYPAKTSEDKFKSWLGKTHQYIRQPEGSIVERMRFAFEHAFAKNYPKTILICSDVPDINHIMLKDAFAELDKNDIVLGPTMDNSLYLLGLKKMHTQLFDLSHAEILDEMTQKIKKAKLSLKMFKELPDIDYPIELRQLWSRLNALPNALQTHRYKNTVNICQELFS